MTHKGFRWGRWKWRMALIALALLAIGSLSWGYEDTVGRMGDFEVRVSYHGHVNYSSGNRQVIYNPTSTVQYQVTVTNLGHRTYTDVATEAILFSTGYNICGGQTFASGTRLSGPAQASSPRRSLAPGESLHFGGDYPLNNCAVLARIVLFGNWVDYLGERGGGTLNSRTHIASRQ